MTDDKDDTTTVSVKKRQRDYLAGMNVGSHKAALQVLIEMHKAGFGPREEAECDLSDVDVSAEVDLEPVLNRMKDLETELRELKEAIGR